MKKLAFIIIVCSAIIYLKNNREKFTIEKDTLDYIESLSELKKIHENIISGFTVFEGSSVNNQ